MAGWLCGSAQRALTWYHEVSLKAMLAKVHYEGYEEPKWHWESTGADGYEPKISFMPLVYGTLKATFYSMIFGAPAGVAGRHLLE